MIKFKLKKILFLICILCINSSIIFTMEPEKQLSLLLTKENGTIETQPTQVLWKDISQFNSIKNMINDLGGIPNEPIPLYNVTHNSWNLINDLANKQIIAEQIPLSDLKAIIMTLNYLDPEVKSIKPAALIAIYAHKLITNAESYKDALFNISDLDNLLIKAVIKEISQSLPVPMPLNLEGNTQQLIQELITDFEQAAPQTNININAKKHISALNFIKMAHALNVPLLENACAQYLGKYLWIYCKNGSPNEHDYTQQDRDKKQFLDQLYALPHEMQKKISKLFLSNNNYINNFTNFFNNQKIKHCQEFGTTTVWSSDSKYFYIIPSDQKKYVSNKFTTQKKIYFLRWNLETDLKEGKYATEDEFIAQGLNNINSAELSDNKYVANWNPENKINISDAKTNQLIEILPITYHLGRNEDSADKEFQWSPDNKKLAFIRTVSPAVVNVIIYPVDLLIQAKNELLSLPLSQLLFICYLFNASRGHGFGVSRLGEKIMLNKEQQIKFDLLPDSLKEMFKSKIAMIGPNGRYY